MTEPVSATGDEVADLTQGHHGELLGGRFLSICPSVDLFNRWVGVVLGGTASHLNAVVECFDVRARISYRSS